MNKNYDSDGMTLIFCLAVSLLLGGCLDPTYPPLLEDAGAEYWELRVDHPAIQMSTLAPHNKLSLTAFPARSDGSEIPIDSLAGSSQNVLSWTSDDSSAVYVDRNGLITALKDIPLVELTASLRLGKVTRNSTVRVRVATEVNPAPIEKFTISPTDSLKRAAINFWPPYIFPATAVNSLGDTLINLPVYWRSSNPKAGKLLNPWDGSMELLKPGLTITVSARTWFYGSVKEDSFDLEIGHPTMLLFPAPSTEVRQLVNNRGVVEYRAVSTRPALGPGGAVAFTNSTGYGPKNILGFPPLEGKEIDIVFDDPTAALSYESYPGDPAAKTGNITSLSKDTLAPLADRRAYRRFTKPGEHYFTIVPFGVRGSIYIHER